VLLLEFELEAIRRLHSAVVDDVKLDASATGAAAAAAAVTW